MTFTSLFFLFGFLPLSGLLSWWTQRRKYANLVLLILSWVFYAFGSLENLLILLFVTVWNYASARQIAADHSKGQLYLAVGINLGLLALYKYVDPVFSLLGMGRSGLLLPAGLSFYMFSCLSCLFDVWYGKAQAPDDFVDFALYAGFFGWVNMGPVQNWARMKEQLHHHPFKRNLFERGCVLFLQGLFFKVLLADNFGLVFQMLTSNTTWLGNLLLGFSYFFQLYFDFAGYSRMARGIAAAFGFEVPENFRHPYTALRVQEFWRRWHISLTSWFREYVYIPLGGNRVDQRRWILNVLAVWILTGIWHGSTLNFVVWGLYQGCLILAEKFFLDKFLKKLPAGLQHLYLVLTQLIGWSFFFSPGLLSGLAVIGRYFGIGITGFADKTAWFVCKDAFVLYVLGSICVTGWQLPLRGKWMQAAYYGLLFLVCVAFLTGATNQTFLYAAF